MGASSAPAPSFPPMPRTVCTLMPSVCDGTDANTAILLNNMRLTGTLPTELGLLADHLTVVAITGNALSGTIPTQWDALTKVTDIVLHNNSLSGTLPAEFRTSSVIQRYSVETNRLSGTLPAALPAVRRRSRATPTRCA